jgi:hypothetical protein
MNALCGRCNLGYPLLYHLGRGLIIRLSHFFGLHRLAFFFGLDGCNNFLDLCLLLQLILLPGLFLDKATMRWNIFKIERVSYL